MFDNWSTLKKLIWLKIRNGGTGPVYKTASGAIVHITDALAAPLKKLVAQIDPVQDLHGQDAPYPPGGGKNKIDITKHYTNGWTNSANNITAVYNNGVFAISGTSNSSGWTNIVNDQFAFQNDGFVIQAGTYTSPAHCTFVINIAGTNTNKSGTFSLSESGTVIGFFISVAPNATTGWSIPLCLVTGSIAPSSYIPYSNECPISGWTGANVHNTKENLFSFSAGRTGYTWGDGFGFADISIGDTGITFNGTSTSEHKFHVVGAAITLEAGTYKAITTSEDVGIYLYGGGVILTSYGLNGEVFTLSSATTFESEHLAFIAKSGASFSNTFVGFQISQVTTIPISWQSTAGTVYGGNIVVNEDGSGVLTGDRKIKTLLNTDNWYYNASWPNVFYTSWANDGLTPRYGGYGQDCICDKYSGAYLPITAIPNGSFLCNTNQISSGAASFAVKDERFSDINSFKASFDSIQLVYELATPLTYQFSNLTQLSTILGTNNIWVDTGDVEVTYKANSRVSNADAMNYLLGGMYTQGDVSDSEALNILLGGET